MKIKLLILISCFPAYFFMLYSYIVGYTIEKKYKLSILKSKLLTGSIIPFAVFYVLLIPFMLFNRGFNFSLILITLVVLLTLGYSLFFCIKDKCIKNIINDWNETDFIHKFIYIILFLIISIIIAYVVTHFKSDADDSYYVAEVTTMMENRSFYNVEPPSGKTDIPFQDQYKIVGYEPLLSFICILFRQNAPAMIHTYLLPYLMLLGFAAIYGFSRVLSETHWNKLFIFTIFFFLYSGKISYNPMVYLLNVTWFGRAILNYVNYIVLASYFIKLLRARNTSIQDIIILSCLLYASYGLATTAIYLFPLAYMAFFITYFAETKDLNEVIKLIIPGLVSVPVAFIKFSIMMTGTYVDKLTSNADSLVYSSILLGNLGGWCAIAIIVFLIIFIAVFGKNEYRYFCILYPIVCFATFLNPNLCSFIASKVTGTSVYQRLVFSLFYYLLPTIALSILFEKKIFNNVVTLYCPFFFLFILGTVLVKRESYGAFINPEKLNPVSIEIGKAMIKECQSYGNDYKPTLLIPDPYALEVRQYTAKPILIWHRYTKMEYLQRNNLGLRDQLSNLYYKLYGPDALEDDIIHQLYQFDVDYVAIPINKDIVDFEFFYNCIYENDELRIYDIRSER